MDRLDTVASLIKKGDILYDIGTDHAYLPLKVYDKVLKAYALDVAQNPLQRAENTIKVNNMSDKVTAILSDGLEKVDFKEATVISICGMGAELIVDILSKNPSIYNKNITFIFQAMTKCEVLRKFLLENGFSIEQEMISKEERRYYTILACRYSGKIQNLDIIDCFVSESLKKDPLFNDYITFHVEKLQEICHNINNTTDEKYIYYKSVISKLRSYIYE